MAILFLFGQFPYIKITGHSFLHLHITVFFLFGGVAGLQLVYWYQNRKEYILELFGEEPAKISYKYPFMSYVGGIKKVKPHFLQSDSFSSRVPFPHSAEFELPSGLILLSDLPVQWKASKMAIVTSVEIEINRDLQCVKDLIFSIILILSFQIGNHHEFVWSTISHISCLPSTNVVPTLVITDSIGRDLGKGTEIFLEEKPIFFLQWLFACSVMKMITTNGWVVAAGLRWSNAYFSSSIHQLS